jgi:K+/H+ antiporter YhaU regulatory subunit KhtT
MYYKKQFTKLKQRLQNQYLKLVEISNNYRFLDESLSDLAAYKAMKLLQKINRVRYLDREATV